MFNCISSNICKKIIKKNIFVGGSPKSILCKMQRRKQAGKTIQGTLLSTSVHKKRYKDYTYKNVRILIVYLTFLRTKNN